ncbi:kappaPI-actitoxin-Avd3b-like [Rhynchophorus ferrugineus]|uniref:kappaPI-actitoxin-Avd3b-like n=1 Tax=Rhynchophorus ferrugineus TaxID=354439 RepID=UPI003FCCA555
MYKTLVFLFISVFFLVGLSKEEALLFSSADCTLPHETGPIHCLAYMPVYTWNNQEKSCEKTIYGGCRRTANNFDTLDECESIARPVCAGNTI